MKLNEDRRFGVEFEVILKVGYSHRDLADRMNNAGIQTIIRGYHHSVNNPTWELKPDGSLRSSQGCEVVSRPLKGRDGLEEVRRVLAIVSDMATVNKNCGLHVHHEVTDLGDQSFKNLYAFYRASQKHIDMMLPASRRNNHYCSKLHAPVERLGSTPMAIKRRLVNMDRYCVLNFESYSIRGTVEFRQHSGTTEYDKFLAWFLLTQSMVEQAHIKRSIKGRDQKSVTDFFWDLGWNLNESDSEYAFARKYLKKRYKKFSEGNRV